MTSSLAKVARERAQATSCLLDSYRISAPKKLVALLDSEGSV
jgi:hypothetical protein